MHLTHWQPSVDRRARDMALAGVTPPAMLGAAGFNSPMALTCPTTSLALSEVCAAASP